MQQKWLPSIDYEQVASSNLSWHSDKPKFVLWTAIAPATTFLAMMVVAFCYWSDALAETNAAVKAAKYSSANAFFAWSIVGLSAYLVLARMTKKEDEEGSKA